MRIKEFSPDDTNVIKGLAILLIILHNLFHWIDPSTGENEFFFSSSHIHNFIDGIINKPFESINLIMSYLGYYGVQLFIFISGYGLAKSFNRRQRTWGVFMIERLKKIYPLMFIGILFFALGKILIHSPFSLRDFTEIAYKLVFVNNFLPDSASSINGPWWFFSLIVQLYILFPLMFNLIKKYNTKALLVMFAVSYLWIYISQFVYSPQVNVYLLYNAPGHIPEFAFGIWFAMNKDKIISNIFGIAAIIIFILGNFYKAFFSLTFLTITFLMIWMFNSIRHGKNEGLRKIFIFYGSISMILFAIHGIFRDPFVVLANNVNTFWGTLLSAVLFVAYVTILSVPAKKMYQNLQLLLNRL